MNDTTRDLIQRLADALTNAIRVIHNEDGTQHVSTAAPVLDEARAYLAQAEPEGPKDEELRHLWLDLYAFHDGPTSGDVAEIARAALARWGK